MHFTRRDHDTNLTAVTESEGVICDGRQMTTTSSTDPIVGNQPGECQGLKAALEKVAAQMPSLAGEDIFDGFPIG